MTITPDDVARNWPLVWTDRWGSERVGHKVCQEGLAVSTVGDLIVIGVGLRPARRRKVTPQMCVWRHATIDPSGSRRAMVEELRHLAVSLADAWRDECLPLVEGR